MNKEHSLIKNVSIIIAFLGLAITTPIFELPYQGSLFWFLVGGVYKSINTNNNLTFENSGVQ